MSNFDGLNKRLAAMVVNGKANMEKWRAALAAEVVLPDEQVDVEAIAKAAIKYSTLCEADDGSHDAEGAIYDAYIALRYTVQEVVRQSSQATKY